MNKPSTEGSPEPAYWSPLQVRLHWLVVVLLALQFLLQGVMVDTMIAVRSGEIPSISGYLLANLHLLSGISIGFLMAYRLYLRVYPAIARSYSGNAPATDSVDSQPLQPPGQTPSDADRSGLLSMAATLVHGLFYLLLLTMPLSGLSAWYEVPGAATVHGWQKNSLLLLLLLHVLAALWHLWVRRDGVFQRIVRF